MEDLLLTPAESAATLKMSRAKLYELIRAGRIESVRIDGMRRIPRSALEAFVARAREGSAA